IHAYTRVDALEDRPDAGEVLPDTAHRRDRTHRHGAMRRGAGTDTGRKRVLDALEDVGQLAPGRVAQTAGADEARSDGNDLGLTEEGIAPDAPCVLHVGVLFLDRPEVVEHHRASARVRLTTVAEGQTDVALLAGLVVRTLTRVRVILQDAPHDAADLRIAEQV